MARQCIEFHREEIAQMSLSLCYTALSPFCRKVRMAVEHKGLAFTLVQVGDPKKLPAWNPRAEVPVLIDDETLICNSSEVRDWERTADTHLEAIVTVIGNWKFANLPPMPVGLMDAARRACVF